MKLFIKYSIFLFVNLFFNAGGLTAQQFSKELAKISDSANQLPFSYFKIAQLVSQKEKLTKSHFEDYNIHSRKDGRVFIEIQFGYDANQKILIPQNWKPNFQVDQLYRNVVGGWISPKDILPFAEILPKDYFLLAPTPPVIWQTGDTVTNATSYMNNVLGGLGLKVAIFEPFYGGIYSSQANGTVPTPFTEHDFSGSGDPFDQGDTHGTGVTEVIYHFAPRAEYHIYKFATPTQFASAMADAIAEGIDVISLSLGFPNTGWDDGSGVPNMAVKDATDAGIVVFCAAGNNAQMHWQGTFHDAHDSDGFHEWSGIDEGNNITVSNGARLAAHLQWKGNPNASNNFDIKFFNGVTGDLITTTSATVGQESLVWTNNTGAAMDVAIIVDRVNSTQTQFELLVINGYSSGLQHSQTGGSIIAPATSAEDLSIVVGAVSRTNYDGPVTYVESYSGRGPSNDGRILPDLVAPTDLIVHTYPSGFGGTSAATPCMAGIALLFWSEHDYLSVEGMIDVLFGFTRLYNPWPFNNVYQDNEWGRGGIELPNYTANSRFIIEGVTNNDVNDRPYNSAEQADAIAPTNLNLFFLGGTFDTPTAPDSDVLNKRAIYRSLEEDVFIKN